MRNAVLFVHIAAAVLLVGPTTFAASAFPRQAAEAGDGDLAALGAARTLHRVSRGYGRASLLVGLTGIALALLAEVWSQAWVWVSLAIFATSWAVLVTIIVPTQAELLEDAEANRTIEPAHKARLHSTTGLYSTAWMIVLALMVLKPG